MMSVTVIHTGKSVLANNVLDKQKKQWKQTKKNKKKTQTLIKTDIYPRIFWPVIPNIH